jgi:hypothetical protein
MLCSESKCHMQTYIQSGVNGLLDVARQSFKEVTSDVLALIEIYRRTFQTFSLTSSI